MEKKPGKTPKERPTELKKKVKLEGSFEDVIGLIAKSAASKAAPVKKKS